MKPKPLSRWHFSFSMVSRSAGDPRCWEYSGEFHEVSFGMALAHAEDAVQEMAGAFAQAVGEEQGLEVPPLFSFVLLTDVNVGRQHRSGAPGVYELRFNLDVGAPVMVVYCVVELTLLAGEAMEA